MPILSEESVFRKAMIVFFRFNLLVSWMVSCSMRCCITSCCLFCMLSMFSCSMFSVVIFFCYFLRFLVSVSVAVVARQEAKLKEWKQEHRQ